MLAYLLGVNIISDFELISSSCAATLLDSVELFACCDGDTCGFGMVERELGKECSTASVQKKK